LILVPKDLEDVEKSDIGRLSNVDSVLVLERVVADVPDLDRLLESGGGSSRRMDFVELGELIDGVGGGDGHFVPSEGT